MARKRKKQKKAAPKKKSTVRKIVLLLLFIGTAAVVYMQRTELVTGIQGHLFGKEHTSVIKELRDIPSLKGFSSHTVRVLGIPDYGNIIRFPFRDKILTCFRMTDFGNRLFVCTEKGLKQPDEIGEVLTQRSVQGRLTALGKSRIRDTLKRGFQRSHRILPANDACLLFEDESSLPSVGKTLALFCCLFFCFFFLYRLIK